MFTVLLQRNLLDVLCTHILHRISCKASPYTWQCIARWKCALVGEKYHVRSWAGVVALGDRVHPCPVVAASQHCGFSAPLGTNSASQSELTQGCETPSPVTRGTMKYSFDSLPCLSEKFCLCFWIPFFEIRILKFLCAFDFSRKKYCCSKLLNHFLC